MKVAIRLLYVWIVSIDLILTEDSVSRIFPNCVSIDLTLQIQKKKLWNTVEAQAHEQMVESRHEGSTNDTKKVEILR